MPHLIRILVVDVADDAFCGLRIGGCAQYSSIDTPLSRGIPKRDTSNLTIPSQATELDELDLAAAKLGQHGRWHPVLCHKLRGVGVQVHMVARQNCVRC